MVKLLLLIVSCATLHAAVGENLRRLPPIPGELPKIALTNVQNAVRTLLVTDVSTEILSGAGNAEKIAYYYAAVAKAFASMETNGNFQVSEIEKVSTPLSSDLSVLQKNILTLYGRAYDYRTRGDLPPLDWLKAVAITFNEAIREGIRQGGRGHILENKP